MRVVLQRVAWARVASEGAELAAIGQGLVALVGVAEGDHAEDANRLARKTLALRLFPDDPAGQERPFHRALTELAAPALLCVSQLTLLADVRRGNRPSWSRAAPTERAGPLVDAYADAVAAGGVAVGRGRFGAHMEVALANDGPVTIVLDSHELAGPRRGVRPGGAQRPSGGTSS